MNNLPEMWRPQKDSGFPFIHNALCFQLGMMRTTTYQCVTGQTSNFSPPNERSKED
jgi:hypothetical protein